MSTESYTMGEASGNGNAETVPMQGSLRAGAARAGAREGLPHPNTAPDGDPVWPSWRAGAAATFTRIRAGLGDGSLWDDHPPSPRDVYRRIHDPVYAGPQVAGWKRFVRYALGYIGLAISTITRAAGWPFESESRFLVTLAAVGVFLLLRAV